MGGRSDRLGSAASRLGLAQRCLQGMRQAQQHYRFGVVQGLAAVLQSLGDDPALFNLQRDGVLLAQKLAMMESDLAAAARWGQALAALHRGHPEPEQQRWALAEPHRQWRLEIGATPAGAKLACEQLKQPGADPAPLLEALEHEPQSTALAFALLLQLRRRGALELALPAGKAPTPIPNQLWLLRRYPIASAVLEQREALWRQHHPGWELAWVDHQHDAIEALEPLPELVRQCALAVLDPAIRGDLLRLALLWLHGGVALEWNLQPRQSLVPLLAGAELLLVQDAFGSIGSTLWAAPPRHPLVEALLQEACERVLAAAGYSRWDLSGACLLSGAMARFLRPALQATGQLPQEVRLISQRELGGWLGSAPGERPPEGWSEPAFSQPLDRRRCSWMEQRFAGGLPPLSVSLNWPLLARRSGQPDASPPELVRSLLAGGHGQAAPALEELLSVPTHWLPLFPLQPPATTASAPAPEHDALQEEERRRQGQGQQLSFDWLPLASQFRGTLAAIRRRGHTPWIVDAGSRSGRSSRWLAERWPQALVVAVVLRPHDEVLMAHTTAGTTVQRLHSLPVAGAELRADDIWGLGLPLEKLPLWIGAHGGEPALLHLDAAMAETEAWFAQGGAWLRPFAVVLLHGALASDEQGRILPQPHQAALAAAGFEMVRSGEVLVAFQRLLLEPSAGVLAHPGKELPALEGKIRQQGGVVAFDGEWQYPAITEQWACHQAMARLGPHPDQVYVGFPWASLIDHLNNGTLRGRALLLELQRLLALLEGRGRRITVCQQIFFQEHRWLFEQAGITDVFWPHATIHSSLPGIRLHPFPLYPVHCRPPLPEQPRDLLYSFIGAQTTRLYLSNSRDLILTNLAGLPGSLIEGYEGWFFDALVYGVQIRSELKADDPRVAGEERRRRQERYIESLQRSLFVICPSGTGPNTIRLWEALASGAIPIVLADTWRPPGPRELWEEAVFFLPDTPQGVMTIPRLAAEWAREVPLLERKRAAMARLWQRYGPDGFIGDIEALWA